MENQELIDLLQRYAKGLCNDEEIAIIEAWYQQEDQAASDPRLTDPTQSDALRDRILSRIKQKIEGHDQSAQPFRFAFFLKLAATILFLAVSAATVYFFNASYQVQGNETNAPVIITDLVVANGGATVQQYVLSDGTRVTLKPGGELTYPAVFTGTSRHVSLKGEAFFDVHRDVTRPFIIETENLQVRVLGTSFNVRSYVGDTEASVTVKTGKVAVKRKQHEQRDAEFILTPNQELIYNVARANFMKKIVPKPIIVLEKPTLFQMEYDETPVDKILDVMEDNYGIKFIYDKKVLSSCALTTSMAEEGFYERIEIICRAIGAEYEMRDGTIIIKSDGCQ